MAKLLRGGKGEEAVEGLYEGPMVYRLLTWHRAKKGEQEEKEEEEKEVEVNEEEAEETQGGE